MRTVTLIIIHCSAVRPNQLSSAKDITQWHKARGWRTIGYHYVVRRDGTVENGRPIEQIGAHCVNHNRYSIGICYEGGLDAVGNPKDTRTDAQKTAIRQLIMRLKKTYPLAVIVGHRDLNPQKACPCFNAVSEYRDLQPWCQSILKSNQHFYKLPFINWCLATYTYLSSVTVVWAVVPAA